MAIADRLHELTTIFQCCLSRPTYSCRRPPLGITVQDVGHLTLRNAILKSYDLLFEAVLPECCDTMTCIIAM